MKSCSLAVAVGLCMSEKTWAGVEKGERRYTAGKICRELLCRVKGISPPPLLPLLRRAGDDSSPLLGLRQSWGMVKVFYSESFLGPQEKCRKVRERRGVDNRGDCVDRCQRNAPKNKSYQIDAALAL